LASDKELSDFLKSVEKRAFKRALYAVRDEDAALDIVQDTMIRLAEKYVDRPAAELPLLFQRIPVERDDGLVSPQEGAQCRRQELFRLRRT
jgi:hypothetical protein